MSCNNYYKQQLELAQNNLSDFLQNGI